MSASAAAAGRLLFWMHSCRALHDRSWYVRRSVACEALSPGDVLVGHLEETLLDAAANVWQPRPVRICISTTCLDREQASAECSPPPLPD
jgi:hypothetical protein